MDDLKYTLGMGIVFAGIAFGIGHLLSQTTLTTTTRIVIGGLILFAIVYSIEDTIHKGDQNPRRFIRRHT